VVPVDARLDPRDENGLRAGWRSGQFFWFDREGVLVEHHAPEGTVTFHRSCRKAPGALFLVDQAAREVVWRDLRGSVSAFDLERVRDASDSPLVPHLLRPAHRVIADAGGRAVARMEGHDSIVEWVRPRTGGGAGVLRLPNAQRPMALDAGARRLLCANSNTIWFWSLDDQRLVRKNVSPSQEVTDLCLGNVAGQDHAGPVSAMRITGRTGAALLLRWAPEGPHRGIQVETFEDLTGERFTCSLDGSREQFIPARLFPGNSIADFRKGLRVGGMVVALVNSRLVEFRRAEDEQPFVRFWFRLKPALWAVASRDAAAGPGAGDLVAPGGGGFARDPHRLAGMLASGTRWNG
jgi:hypothetical protein